MLVYGAKVAVFGFEIANLLSSVQDVVGPLCILFGPTILLERRLIARLKAAEAREENQ